MKVVILSGYGLNCENETAFAFSLAGEYLKKSCNCKIVHVNDLIANSTLLEEAQIFVIPGGFSFSDYSGAGNALAVILANRLLDKINDFIQKDKLILGICNGCQVLVRLIPCFSHISIKNNDIGVYRCHWVNVKNNNSKSPWLVNIDKLYMPIAHGEGKFVFNEASCNEKSIALKYTQAETNMCIPYNPNGSMFDTAGVIDQTGKILALMPHPERAILFSQRPDWTLIQSKSPSNTVTEHADGFKIFANAVRYFA